MSELETYDSEGPRTYILEAGDYYLTIGNGSHEPSTTSSPPRARPSRTV